MMLNGGTLDGARVIPAGDDRAVHRSDRSRIARSAGRSPTGMRTPAGHLACRRRGVRPHRIHRHVDLDRPERRRVHHAADQPREPDAQQHQDRPRARTARRRRDVGASRARNPSTLSSRAHESHRDRLGDRRRVLPAVGRHRVRVHEEGRREPRASTSSRGARCRGGSPARRWSRRRSRPTRRSSSRASSSSHGVAGNWLWWNMLMSGMLTVFFFARLWRRANVMTDVEFAEVRYSGKPRRVAPRLPRALSRDPDQPDHPRLGDARDDQDPHDLARAARRADRAA